MKIKLTKGELKKQRDSLHQFERYLPTLQLKKQQLQLEIFLQSALLEEKNHAFLQYRKSSEPWLGLLAEGPGELANWLKPVEIMVGLKNIAGVDIPLFQNCRFNPTEYDLFITPLWVDLAVEQLRKIISLREEIRIIQRGIFQLRNELRIATQRVNLFEKVKIPEAREAIRMIKIYIGDQMANAVGRSKIAKAKVEEGQLVGVGG
jgi:V/A-type H+-transporting ATPase subunit D